MKLHAVAAESLISPPEEIIAEAQRGRMFILADDEDRENEGDLVIPAQFVTPEAINFMARYGRGLICLAMEGRQIERLGLPMMSQNNGTRFQTAFTVSIEAREGVTTGISAADRAHTIQTAIAPDKGPQDIVTPGHVFPLMARPGGVLERAGQTEGSVDIARLAGLIPASVICEIMNEDGTMARLPDLAEVARQHNLKIGTVADLIAYRRRTETIVERRLSQPFTSIHGGDFAMHIYVNRAAYAEHVALVKGDISGPAPVLVRMHALDVLEDVLGDRSRGHGGELQASMRMIAEEGRGVIVLLREAQAASLSEKLAAREKQPQSRLREADKVGEPQSSRGPCKELRNYGVGAQILIDLGVRDMILLSNSQRTIVGLDGYGLRLVEQRAIGG
ncbi:MAG: 3,4-dihydroxy-2-butanone-4-phosphate synthase [Alphaproteobacteria bacterium]|nr:3,4-dihydroxy-2-butanone-4-phosphate synthase [Alphaproteobacteria bacterium]